jgi:hypothetical protein
MKVFYHGDNDGRCAGFLFWKWVERKGIEATPKDFREIDYNMTFPREIIKEGEAVYFLDFHPEKEEDYVWLTQHTDLCIVDHHITTNPHLWELDDKYQFLPNPKNIIDIEACGAMLVAKHFLGYTDDNMPEFIKLVDDWDRWVHANPMSKYFNAGSKMYDTTPFGGFWATFWLELGDKDPFYFIRTVTDNGCTILSYIGMNAKELCASIGYPVEFDGFRCFALNQSRCNSTWFESVPGYDIYLPHNFNGEKWTVSLYSTTVDVSVIAKIHGGGGHAGAAGFVCDELPWKKGI